MRIKIPKPKLSKKVLLISGATLLTLANGSGLGYALMQRTKPTGPTSLQEVVKPKIDVKNAEKRDVAPTAIGEKIGEGEYKSQTLKKSRIKTGNSAQLSIATHEQTGGHFVLAFLSGGNIPSASQLGSGWKLETIANDPMWAPGACASKPTFLIGGKHIFIDDGKTSDEDKYDSYIVFDMTTGEYKYFGGNDFTTAQATKEVVMTATNENDKIVFYIDPVDDQPYITDNALKGHTKGKDHAYVIRREIDPVTLKYTDYSLPFTVPDALTHYYVSAYNSSDDGVHVSLYIPYSLEDKSYSGTIASNRINLKLNQPGDVNVSGPLDTPLELALESTLRQAAPGLTKQNNPYDGSQYKTVFSIGELGTYKQLQFLNASQRYGISKGDETLYYATPLIYDKDSKKSYPLVTQALLRSYTDYVNLGAF